MVKAIGFQSAGFARMPGGAGVSGGLNSSGTIAGSPAEQLTKNGVDFLRQASDGSVTLAHWMQFGCCQGQGPLLEVNGSRSAAIEAIQGLVTA